MGKKVQHMWSQSLYILCCLLEEGLLNIGEIDPLNRRLSMLPKPDTLIQGKNYVYVTHPPPPPPPTHTHTHVFVHTTQSTLYFDNIIPHPHPPTPTHTHMYLSTLHNLLYTSIISSPSPPPTHTHTVVLLAEDRKLHTHLKKLGITTDTIHHCEHNRRYPVRILPARYLGNVYQKLGICEKIGLSGRPRRKLGVIATSQLYSYSYHSRQMMVAFTPSVSVELLCIHIIIVSQFLYGVMDDLYLGLHISLVTLLWYIHIVTATYPLSPPQFLDHETFYLSLDNQMLVDLVRTDLAYIKSNWKLMGRPTLVLPILW